LRIPLLLGSVALSGCGAAPASREPPVTAAREISEPCASAHSEASPATPPPVSPAPPALGILRFDCNRPDDGQSLRGFNGGGPDGSAWNWYGSDFDCSVTVRLDCEARIRVIVRVGERGRMRAETTSAAGSELTTKLVIPWELWEAELEQGDSAIDTVPYETLLFVARVDGLCLPTEQEPSGRFFYWTDSFLGGFSGGE
jgi:hypothetical protein